MAKDKILEAFLQAFKDECPRIREAHGDRIFSDYAIFIYSNLNCENLEAIARFIRNHFSVEGNYTHCLPTIGTQRQHGRDVVAIRINAELIEERFG